MHPGIRYRSDRNIEYIPILCPPFDSSFHFLRETVYAVIIDVMKSDFPEGFRKVGAKLPQPFLPPGDGMRLCAGGRTCV